MRIFEAVKNEDNQLNKRRAIMKLVETKPNRVFQAGLDRQISISDCGKIYLEPDEQVTFVNSAGREYDVAAKSWGFYATPSVNGRLKNEGYKTALVKNQFEKYYILVVDSEKIEDFEDYVKSESQQIVEWLDER